MVGALVEAGNGEASADELLSGVGVGGNILVQMPHAATNK